MSQAFLGGLYGVNLLRRPTLAYAHGDFKLASDGAKALLDGKHTFMALKALLPLYLEDAARAEAAATAAAAAAAGPESATADTAAPATAGREWSTALVEALTVGVKVQVMEFDGDERDLGFAWAVQAHDVDSNQYKVEPSGRLLGSGGMGGRAEFQAASGTPKPAAKFLGDKLSRWACQFDQFFEPSRAGGREPKPEHFDDGR